MKPRVLSPESQVPGAAAPVLPADAKRAAASTRRTWDRGLLALVVLFVSFAPLVTHRIYASDEIQYFSYTHSLFFDHDLDFSNQYLYFCNVDKLKFADFCRDLYGKHEPDTGLPINVAPIGTGLFWMPPFALTHVGVLLARSLGAKVAADGFSPPYIYAITWASYAYGCIGLFLCYLLARRLFGSGLAALAVITVWLATSVIFYTVVAPPWSHATSLMTVTFFLWLWARTRRPEGRTFREWALLGLAAGAMMLVREQDALFMIVPALEAAVIVVAMLRQRSEGSFFGLSPLPRLVGGLAIMGLVAAVVFIPQLIAYRVITGHFSPSKVVSSKFTWTSPNFLNVLFSPEHGLVPWTPVIALGLLGLALLWRRDRVLASALVLAFVLQVYIAGSFLTWQSASSFGQRRFINSTAIFALGLAALLSWLLANGMPRWLIALVPALFIAWNAGLLMQYALWCSQQRQALDWALVLRGQVEMPTRAAGLLWDFVFNRAVFYRSTKGC
jgi:hypothetical protein